VARIRKYGIYTEFCCKILLENNNLEDKRRDGMAIFKKVFWAKLTQKTKKKRNNTNIKASSYDFVSPKQLLP
jgi:hypothetical protein